MVIASAQPAHLRRAVILMTASSVLVPAAGLLTQPILARALGADGRGEMAAAMAPSVLLGAVATLGLPDALTYFAARVPRATRAALSWSAVFSVVMGLICVAASVVLAPYLSAGDANLSTLIIIATCLVVPVLVVGAVRGAARGYQAWNAIALESIVGTGLRVSSYVILWLTGELTVLTAVLATSLAQVLGAAVYLPLLQSLRRTTGTPSGDHEPAGVDLLGASDVSDLPTDAKVLGPLLRYGGRVWFGSVASMLVARIGQVLMVPLSSVRDLGLYTVASTISDVPLVVSLAVSGALQGVNSRSNDAEQVATTARITTLISALGCLALAALVPLLLVPLFGAEFEAALIPTLMLLAAAVIVVPGLMAGAGLAAFGRPGLRSIGLFATFAVNIAVFVPLVPVLGVIGACWTSIISSLVLSGFMVVSASRVMQQPVQNFLIIRGSDVALVWRESRGLLVRAVPRRRMRRHRRFD